MVASLGLLHRDIILLARNPVKHDYRVSTETLADLLKREMLRREWNQSELAQKVGKPPSMISRWLAGQRPSSDSCDLIADALGVSVDDVLTLAKRRPVPVNFNPDDPRARIIARLTAAQLSPARLRELAAYVDLWEAWDRQGEPTWPGRPKAGERATSGSGEGA